MIYNENGVILNEEYILEDYFNNSSINSIINESFKDPKTKFGKTVKAAIDWLVKKVGEAWQFIINIPNRAKIIANKKKIKDALYDVRKSDDNKLISVKIKGEIAKYIGSDGYKNGGMWFKNFETAVKTFTNENKNLSIDQVKSILYGGSEEDNWFINEKLASYSKVNLDTDKIVDFAINVSELSKPLKSAHNELLRYNKKLDKDAKIDGEVLNAINHYFTKAMSSVRNLSYACITVCMNALKGNTSDSAERGTTFDRNKNVTGRRFNKPNGDTSAAAEDDSKNNVVEKEPEQKTADINDEPESKQIEMIKDDPNMIKNIDNPSDSLIKKSIDNNPEIFKKCPPLNEELTKYCYYKLYDAYRKKGDKFSTTQICYDLRYFHHKVTDEIRIHAFNNEQRLLPNAALKNIAPLVDGNEDISSLSKNVIDNIFNTYMDNAIKEADDDFDIVNDISKFTYKMIMELEDDKYAEIAFNKIRSSISSDIDKNEFMDVIKNGSRKDVNNFIKKFE